MKSLFLFSILFIWPLTGSYGQVSVHQKSLKVLNQFIEKPTVPAFKKLEEVFEQQITAMKPGQLAEWQRTQKGSFFLDATKIYFTHLLPEGFPGRVIYMTCFSELYLLRKDLTQSKLFESYQTCLNYQFNSYLPPNYKKLLGALKKLNGQ